MKTTEIETPGYQDEIEKMNVELRNILNDMEIETAELITSESWPNCSNCVLYSKQFVECDCRAVYAMATKILLEAKK